MIFVDAASGSNTLAPLLEKAGLPVYRGENGELPHLEYADVEFTGRGVGGEQIQIGIEVKRLSELTGDWDRFAGHQTEKMNLHYAHRYLVYEGEWMQNKRGSLLKRVGRATFKPLHGQCNATQLRKKLITMEMCGGFHVMHIPHWGRDGSWSVETVRYIQALYYWWTDEDFDKHKSHIVNYEPQGVIPMNKFQRAFAAWPKLSTKRAKAVAKAFGNSIARACDADEDTWAEVVTVDDEGRTRKLGIETARSILRFIHGKD